MGWFSRKNKATSTDEVVVIKKKQLTDLYTINQAVNVLHPQKNKLQVGKITQINNLVGTLTIEFAGGFKTVIDPETEVTFNPNPHNGSINVQ